MCQKCVDIVREVWGPLSDEDMHRLLMSATAYPFAGGEDIRQQLVDAKRASGGNIGAACAYAAEIMDRDMREFAAADAAKGKA